MWDFFDFFFVLIIVAIIIFWMKKHYAEVEYVESSIDKRRYLVLKLPNKQEAADRLAKLNANFQHLIRHMMAKYPDNADVKRLYENYSPDSLSEGSPDSSYTSYSVNKGEKLVLCLRQKDEMKSFVDLNVVTYVSVHETAHIACNEVGHTKKFWELFKFILTEAIELGIYKKVDFAKQNEKYCGIVVSSSVI